MAKGLADVVATAMSLSFPLLFCAVPCYEGLYDKQRAGEDKWRKNMVSDGGNLQDNFQYI